MRKEAYLWKSRQSLKLQICERRCIISEGKTGFCEMRENNEDKIYSLNYAAASSLAVDPIEKKPLFNFYPGSTVLSIEV